MKTVQKLVNAGKAKDKSLQQKFENYFVSSTLDSEGWTAAHYGNPRIIR